MSSCSSGTRPTVKPSGSGRFPLLCFSSVVEEAAANAAVDMFHRFQYEILASASLGWAMRRMEAVIYSCTHANLRIGEKGQPGASGIWTSLRKRTMAVTCAVKVSCCRGERPVDIGLLISGLKSHIWDSEWRDRSAKMMV